MQATPQTEIEEAAVALGISAASFVQAGTAGYESAEAIVDAALDACGDFQQRLRAAVVRTLGGAEAEVDAYMQELVATVRTRLIRAVDERRAPSAWRDNERTTWANCVRAHAAALASRPGASEALAEEALRQCASDEASVHEELIRERGGPAADKMMPILVGALRNIAMQAIRQVRAAGEDNQ